MFVFLCVVARFVVCTSVLLKTENHAQACLLMEAAYGGDPCAFLKRKASVEEDPNDFLKPSSKQAAKSNDSAVDEAATQALHPPADRAECTPCRPQHALSNIIMN